MGLSGGGSSTSVSGSAQEWAKPFARKAAGQAGDVFNANQGMNQQLADNVTGLVPGLLSRFNQGNAGVQAANGYATDVLGGKYLSGNPYLESIIGKMRSGVADGVNSQFGLAGRYGSGAHTGVLADSLADAEAGLRYGDYNAQMGRMDQMAGMTPALAQAEYTGLPEILQTSALGAELPYAGLNNYTNALSALFNGGTQTQKGPGLFSQLLGAGAQIGSAALMGGK